MMVIAPVRFCWVGLDGLERLQYRRGILRETTFLFESSLRRDTLLRSFCRGRLNTYYVDKLKDHKPPSLHAWICASWWAETLPASVNTRAQERVEERSGFSQQHVAWSAAVTLLEFARALGV